MIIGRDRAFRIFIIAVVLWFVFVITDFVRANGGNDPVFCLSMNYSSSECREYVGIFYTLTKTVETDELTGDTITTYSMAPWFAKSLSYYFTSAEIYY